MSRARFFALRSLPGLLAGALLATPAAAQSSSCQDLGKLMQERQGLIARVNNLGKKQVDPDVACQIFTKLATNGTSMNKFIEGNKDWCQIPDQFAEGIKNDLVQTQKIRGQACKAAAQKVQMMRQARQAQQQQGGQTGGLLGGPGLSGQFKIPNGAL